MDWLRAFSMVRSSNTHISHSVGHFEILTARLYQLQEMSFTFSCINFTAISFALL